MPDLAKIRKVIRSSGDKERAKNSAWFFKTGKGEYGEGDLFLGIRVPIMRKIAKQFFEVISLSELRQLLNSKYHEDRFIALEMLVMKFEHGDPRQQKQIVEFYLKSTKHVNNWDLVDTSAGYILGVYLINKPRSILRKLAKSKILWERRIAIIATQPLIARGQFDDTLAIAKMLLKDKHDLIHKAVGWMLREVGNCNLAVETKFLDQYAHLMPRTMLRYAIEKFPEPKRQVYLKKRMV